MPTVLGRSVAAIAVTIAIAAGSALPSAGAHRIAAADGELVLGSLVPETGPQSTLLDSLRVPVQLAVDEMNAAGGVNGAPVRLVTGDEGATFDVARQTLDRMLTTDHVDAVIGPSGSATVLALVRQIGARQVLTCSGSDTAATLDRTSARGYYFRTAPPDRLQATALADLVLADGRRRVAVVHRADQYGRRIATPLERKLRDGDARVVASIGYEPTPDGTAKLVAAAKPDAVVVIGFAEDGAAVVQALIANGVGPANIGVYGTDGLQSTGFAGLVAPGAPGAVAGIKGTAPAAAPAGISSPFTAALAVRAVEPIFSAYYYDCAILTALAAVRAGSDDPTALKSTFADNLRGSEDCNTFAACKQLLESGATIHWRGASSRFERFRVFEPATGAYDVWTYDASGAVVTADASQQIHVG